MNLRFTLLSFLGLLALCSAGAITPGVWTSLILDGQAVTLTTGNPRFLKVEDIRISDDTQVWKFENGYFVNKAFPNYVFDVYNGVAAEGARVIGYNKKNPVAKNQQFTVLPDGRIYSALGYYLSKRADGTVIISKTARTFSAEAPVVGPLTCTSWGDPHFVRFDSTRYDFYGVGDFFLSEASDNIVQARQYTCNGGVSCNEKLAIKPAGYDGVIIIADNTVTINGTLFTDNFIQLTPKVSVTRSARGVFRVQLDNGWVDSISYGWHHTYYVTLTSGYLPKGGLCQALFRAPATRAVRGLNVARAPQHAFGLSWIVRNAAESLFEYITKSFEDVNQPDYPPNYGPYTTDDPELLAAADEVCDLLFIGEPVTVSHQEITYTATRRNVTTYSIVYVEQGLLAGECDEFFMEGDTAKHHRACVDDVIATARVTAAQPALASYATLCYQTATKWNRNVVLPAIGQSSTASGPGLAAEIAVSAIPYSFTIWAKDAVGRALTKGGDNFTVDSQPALEFTITDLNNGSYQVSFTATQLGAYVINVRHKGIDHVQGSPFDVIVEI